MPSIQEDTSPNAPLIRAREDDDNALHDGPTTPSALQHSGNAFIWALTVAACVSGLLFGYDTASISGMLVSIGTDLSSRPLSNLDKGFITSSTSFFALVASPVAGSLADTVGRKNIILFSDGLFIFGALWQAFTSSAWGMILGRSVVGFAIGGASLIVPLYIAELAPGHLRGRLVTVTLLFITGGQVIAYLVGWAFSTMSGGWRWMVGLGAAPAIAQIAMLVFMPETPRFLAKAQKEVEARAVLAKVYRGMVPDTSELIAETMSAIKKEILEEEEAHVQLKTSESGSCIPPTLHSLLLHPPHARALAITCILQGLQQLCGFNSLMYFSATIFQRLRFSSPTLTSLSVAGTNFLFTIAAFHLIDRVGRRRILLITVPLMTVALVLCATAFSFVEAPQQHQIKAPESNADTIPNTRLPAIGILVAILLYVSTYAMGLGPVPWQQSELFPLSVRSLGSGLATATNWGCNTVVGLTFLPMMDLLTPTWTFVSYALVCLIGWLIIWHIYPETMGLGLEQVGDLLKDGWGVKESMDRLKATRRSRRALE
ncbi:MFS transporter [Exophiala viscosa]|uniref:MFS transporter n=1 Tax=Exophiala viscosa TaxID=2486360 RepID=UPI0021A11817|nr:MFS transporter [Exophiala viscosa]